MVGGLSVILFDCQQNQDDLLVSTYNFSWLGTAFSINKAYMNANNCYNTSLWTPPFLSQIFTRICRNILLPMLAFIHTHSPVKKWGLGNRHLPPAKDHRNKYIYCLETNELSKLRKEKKNQFWSLNIKP